MSGKNPPANTRYSKRSGFDLWVGWKDPLEEDMATHSCLENPMDRGAWRATVHGVTKHWTQLKRLSTPLELLVVLRSMGEGQIGSSTV